MDWKLERLHCLFVFKKGSYDPQQTNDEDAISDDKLKPGIKTQSFISRMQIWSMGTQATAPGRVVWSCWNDPQYVVHSCLLARKPVPHFHKEKNNKGGDNLAQIVENCCLNYRNGTEQTVRSICSGSWRETTQEHHCCSEMAASVLVIKHLHP